MPIRTVWADPTDIDIDTFSSGVEEIDVYFRGRHWFDAHKGMSAPPTYKFLTEDGGVIGYAAVAFKSVEFPGGSGSKGRYLTIFVVGVVTSLHGVQSAQPPHESYATSIFRFLEDLAKSKQNCVGMFLRVRVDNHRAAAFYRKFGFIEDPSGPVQRDERAPHLTMVKPFARTS